MENEECRCGGMNPDCIWCGGTGYVKSREASKSAFWSGTGPGGGPDRRNKKVKFKHQLAPEKPRRGRSGKDGSRSLTDGKIKTHPTLSTLPSKGTPQAVTRCPYCQVRALPSVLRDHIELAHAMSKNKPPKPKVNQAAKFDKDSRLTMCPKCHSRVRPDRLQNHLRERCTALDL